jgi:hypothetical protein
MATTVPPGREEAKFLADFFGFSLAVGNKALHKKPR